MYTKRKLVYGVGTNDSNGVCQNNTIYSRWAGMLKRCYSSNYLQLNPSYVGCTVCDEWLLFSNFKSWMEKQDWEGNELDKDLLGDGKLYSPDTCVFIESKLNYFLKSKSAKSSPTLLGVSKRKSYSKFSADCNDPINTKKVHLGQFDTELEAHKAWQAKKHEYACQLADMQEDERVAKALRERYAPDKDWTKVS